MIDPDDDARQLARMGYKQELARVLGGFSNFAISLSIICILSGGLTSFHLGYDSVGGASIGLGWPLVSLFALAVAATMGQLASAFPTAGGLYHWASILGGRGAGWITAWFNLLGTVIGLAAINVGAVGFAAGAFLGRKLDPMEQALAVACVTFTQAAINHRGIQLTKLLIDFSGWWILAASVVMTSMLLFAAESWDFGRLFTFTNNSGLPQGGETWPRVESLGWLFALGFLLPAYTITGFDASAHASEETKDAGHAVPRGIVRAVLYSGIFGWILLASIVLAMKDTAPVGDAMVPDVIRHNFSQPVATALFAAAAVAQYLCGLATVTSASRILYAFARDGGVPFPNFFKHVSPAHRSPARAVWGVSAASVVFTLYTPVYATITAVCVIFIYVAYVMPTAIGAWRYSLWKDNVGPWNLGRWFRPLAVISVMGCIGLIVTGMQPPNDRSAVVVGGMVILLTAIWYGYARRHFPGPPVVALGKKHGG